MTELDRWHAAGRTADFWWRDDDATALTPALHRLFSLSSKHSAPLALAVIPAGLEDGFALPAGIWILQHGIAHANRAGPGAKKCELADGLDPAKLVAALCAGRERLGTAFGDRFLPTLVPPWNRIAASLVPHLREAGITGLSTYKARVSAAVHGLVHVNCHADPIHWRGGRGYLGDAAFDEAVAGHLRARRTGAVDPAEPTGLLSHHLAMDHATWDGLDAMLAVIVRHPGGRIVSVPDLFPGGSAA